MWLMDKVMESTNQIISYYQQILSVGDFEMYEQYQDEINVLFAELKCEIIMTYHKQELGKLFILHQDIQDMIQREYDQLVEEKNIADQKKRVSNVYKSDAIEYNSIFFDQKR